MLVPELFRNENEIIWNHWKYGAKLLFPLTCILSNIDSNLYDVKISFTLMLLWLKLKWIVGTKKSQRVYSFGKTEQNKTKHSQVFRSLVISNSSPCIRTFIAVNFSNILAKDPNSERSFVRSFGCCAKSVGFISFDVLVILGSCLCLRFMLIWLHQTHFSESKLKKFLCGGMCSVMSR